MVKFISSSVESSCKCLCKNPLSIRPRIFPSAASLSATTNGSIVCFETLLHPSLPNATPNPQYSHVITISPNFGEIGAPQLGHLIDVALDGATIGRLGAAAVAGFGSALKFAPHFIQNAASSGS
ncbi:MAG TPA: hypothetical protein VLV31_03380 [Candidatus Acidoferrales bacterium]|nr:hypothetical protein [Candidatus Acidoferrales bacterium]